ncbi:PAAR domain-containing protein [Photorhabdus viridis]
MLKNIIQQGDKTSHGGSVLAGDPDVERAIQVYSLFASRLRDKIADDFPE